MPWPPALDGMGQEGMGWGGWDGMGWGGVGWDGGRRHLASELMDVLLTLLCPRLPALPVTWQWRDALLDGGRVFAQKQRVCTARGFRAPGLWEAPQEVPAALQVLERVMV